MIRTIEGTIDPDGQIHLDEVIKITSKRRALITILDEKPLLLNEEALLSEAALAKDWNTPEEDKAWAYLQQVP